MRTTLLASVLVLSAANAVAMPLDVMTTTVDPQTGTIAFNMHFTGTPDFLTHDGYGQQADAFQLWLYTAPRTDTVDFTTPADHLDRSLIGFNDGTSWAMGIPVLRFTTDGFGEGTVTARLPFTETQNLVSFTAPVAALGLSGAGPFGYAHATFENGIGGAGWNFYGGCTTNAPCAMAEPGSGWLLVLGAVLIGWRVWRQR